jgi:hypothetical protein
LLHDALKMARGELAALKQSAPKQLQAGFAPLFKLGEEFLDGAKTTKSDNQVVLDVKRPETLDTAAASIAGAVRQQLLEARFAGLRAQRMNNLRQIALAAQYYEAGSMRAPRVIEANGKPVLSWRVAILPYLDEAALYKEFHLTEPWDSPHNLEVAKKIPLVYQSPDGPQDGRTRIMVFTGKGTVFESGKEVRVPPPELSMMSPEAGSNTIICVEAGADKAVVWTSRSILRTRWPRWGRLRPTAFSPRFSTGACINSRLTTKRSMP